MVLNKWQPATMPWRAVIRAWVTSTPKPMNDTTLYPLLHFCQLKTLLKTLFKKLQLLYSLIELQMDRLCGTVVEHTPSNPELVGSNPIGSWGVVWKAPLSLSILFLGCILNLILNGDEITDFLKNAQLWSLGVLKAWYKNMWTWLMAQWGLHSTEVVFALLTQCPQFWFSAFPRTYFDVAEIYRLDNVDRFSSNLSTTSN